MESREDEIRGGLSNALDRGEDLPLAMQSFLNAGYTSQEVELASRKLNEVSETPLEDQNIVRGEEKPLPVAPKVTKRKWRYRGWLIGLLATIGIFIVSLILLYIFQDKVF